MLLSSPLLLPLLLLLLVFAARTGSGIRCYSLLCSSQNNDTGRCHFRRDEAQLELCHYRMMLETHVRVDVGELTPAQTLRGIRDQDMRCIHAQYTAVWSSGHKKVDFRTCMPPDPLRCQILHNSTIRKYENLHGHHGTRVYWDCSMCDTDGCNSGDSPSQSSSLQSHSSSSSSSSPLLLLILLALAASMRLLVT